MVLCPSCKKNEANTHPVYGVVVCSPFEERRSQETPPSHQVEFTTEEIKEQRNTFADDILQPYREGELSKEYLEKYGTKSIKATPQEIKKAKNVWRGDTSYYKG